MKVSKNLAKWAYAWNYALDRKPYYHEHYAKWDQRNQHYPENISLCPLFWRTFVVTPALILTGLFVTGLALTGLRDFIGPIAIAATAITAAFGVAWLLSKIIPYKTLSAVAKVGGHFATWVSPVFTKAVEVKKTMCPFFEVEQD